MFTGRSFKRAAIAAASLGGVLTPVPALFAAADAVKVEVTGNITPACSSGSTTVALNPGDISKAGSASSTFTVDCNAPFQYSMQSANGALQLVNAPAKAAASSSVPYDVHIRIPLTLGGAIDDTCNSVTIKQGAVNCKFSDSGQKIAVNQTAQAQISWSNAQGQLIAGQYTDRLTVTVSVKL